MPNAAASQDGPQEIGEYTYPQGNLEDGWEVVSRHGRIKADPRLGIHEREFEQADGKGGLPINDQPKTLLLRMPGRFLVDAGVTLWFGCLHGTTDAYVLYKVLLDRPEASQIPFTIVQRQTQAS